MSRSGGSPPHERVELPQSLLDLMAEHDKRRNDRLELESLDIAKEYVRGRLGFLIKFKSKTRAHGGYVRDPIYSDICLQMVKRRDDLAARASDADICEGGDGKDRGKDGVLVVVVDQPEVIEWRATPAWVRLQSREELLRIGSGCFYSVAGGFVTDIAVPAGEFEPTILCSAVPSNQFPCRVIKSGPEVMNRIANDQGDVGGKWGAEAYANCHFAGVRIRAESKRVRITLDEALESDFQISDVLLGPLNLGPSAGE